jgi:hypothetical protein
MREDEQGVEVEVKREKYSILPWRRASGLGE